MMRTRTATTAVPPRDAPMIAASRVACLWCSPAVMVSSDSRDVEKMGAHQGM